MAATMEQGRCLPPFPIGEDSTGAGEGIPFMKCRQVGKKGKVTPIEHLQVS